MGEIQHTQDTKLTAVKFKRKIHRYLNIKKIVDVL